MQYYHDLVTEQSWKLLHELHHAYDFVLIGGWAVYLYTHSLKSKDIDLVCSHETLEKFRTHFTLIKNQRLRKYEIHRVGIDVDIYIPFFSELGIPADALLDQTQLVEGFRVLRPESLLVLKQKAYRDRAHSPKGEKDKMDIIALLHTAVDPQKYRELLRAFNLEKPYIADLLQLLKLTRDVPSLDMSEHQFSRFKRKLLTALQDD